MNYIALQKSQAAVLSPWGLSSLRFGPATLPTAPWPSGSLPPSPGPCWSFPTGDLLIIMAQIIVSIQMVLEEKFVYKHNVHPLRAVGTEGEWAQGLGEGAGQGARWRAACGVNTHVGALGPPGGVSILPPPFLSATCVVHTAGSSGRTRLKMNEL